MEIVGGVVRVDKHDVRTILHARLSVDATAVGRTVDTQGIVIHQLAGILLQCLGSLLVNVAVESVAHVVGQIDVAAVDVVGEALLAVFLLA